ncbi:DUF4062 domain-containing protein [Actinomadura sp. 3N407]|uniref:DUF4062 domain-containing protein n=1 Tax=Actinomadura sp. 3N407 TaxID=3457423 RepID=UPI003FCC84FE
MPYTATVLRAMIASPSDVPEARDAVEKAIHGWNSAHAQRKGLILQPWRWETSAVPMLGAHPQKLINAQGVDDSDIVFALFGGRLGSPTPDAVSGTAEEIDRALKAGKPVHLYFSTAPLPHDIDTVQLDALRAFKTDMYDRGLLGEFSTPEQLNHEVWKAIEHDIATLYPDTESASRPDPTAVDFRVQPQQERELSGHNSKGKPRYRTRRWVDVTNTSGRDAEEVTFASADKDSGMTLGPNGPTTIHAGQTRRVPITLSLGGSGDPVLRIRWTEDGEQKERDFHVG